MAALAVIAEHKMSAQCVGKAPSTMRWKNQGSLNQTSTCCHAFFPSWYCSTWQSARHQHSIKACTALIYWAVRNARKDSAL